MDPVLKAIKEGDAEALKAMIQEGKNLAEPNTEGWLPLHEAAYYGQLGCLKVLQQGEWPSLKGQQGPRALPWWGRAGHVMAPPYIV